MALAIDRARVLRLVMNQLTTALGADVLVLGMTEAPYARATQTQFVKVVGLSESHAGRNFDPASPALSRITLTLNCTVLRAAGGAGGGMHACETLVSKVIAALRLWSSSDVSGTGHVIEIGEAEAVSQAELDEDRKSISAGVTFGGLVQRASGTTFESS